MEVETQERIWRMWEKLLTEASGDQPYPEAIVEVSRLLSRLIDALQAVGTKEAMLTLLAPMTEPAPGFFDKAEGVANYLMGIIHGAIRVHMEEGLKSIPQPTGGRPVTQTWEDKERVPQLILQRVATGLSVAEAKRRVARETGLHNKAVERIWAQRSLSPAAKMSRQDAERLVRSLFQTYGLR